MRKEALPTVFRQLVLEGRNQKEAARRCRCAKSLISARVKVIESPLARDQIEDPRTVLLLILE